MQNGRFRSVSNLEISYPSPIPLPGCVTCPVDWTKGKMDFGGIESCEGGYNTCIHTSKIGVCDKKRIFGFAWLIPDRGTSRMPEITKRCLPMYYVKSNTQPVFLYYYHRNVANVCTFQIIILVFFAQQLQIFHLYHHIPTIRHYPPLSILHDDVT